MPKKPVTKVAGSSNVVTIDYENIQAIIGDETVDRAQLVLQQSGAVLHLREIMGENIGAASEPPARLPEVVLLGVADASLQPQQRRAQAADLAGESQRRAPRRAERRPLVDALTAHDDALLDAIERR